MSEDQKVNQLQAILRQILADCDHSGDWTCVCCGKPAVCFGGYAGCHDDLRFTCDECCDHSQEDGWCVQTSVLEQLLGK